MELAIQQLSEVAAQFPTASIVHTFLARMLSKEGLHDRAIERGQDAVRLSPKSEIASLALFLALWKAGHRDAALDEMKRYMAIGKSKEYSRLIKEFRRIMDEEDEKENAG